MPFKPDVFVENATSRVEAEVGELLARTCKTFSSLTTPPEKARCIRSMMTVLDQSVDERACRSIMEACGRHCLGSSVMKKAQSLKRDACDLDDLLDRLNRAHIGGEHLRREGNVIHVAYDRCYCGSVSKTRELFSATYCHCSCGWLRGLFEALLERPVEVELRGSIIQGDSCCTFEVRY